MSHSLEKSEINRGRNGSLVLVRDGRELCCPYSITSAFCGDWCPHFVIVASGDLELRCVVNNKVKLDG